MTKKVRRDGSTATMSMDIARTTAFMHGCHYQNHAEQKGEPMSRLIDAGALIAEMHNVILEDGEDRRTFYEVIERQPTIEPERKKGKWIGDRLISTNGGTYGVRRCSECEAYYQDVGYGWNYCPNCGAGMREEGEQDD